MTQKALTKMKMMTKVGIGVSLVANVLVVPMFSSNAALRISQNPGAPAEFEYFNLPFLAMILTIVLSFGAMLGEPFFKMITPQEHYIKRAKLNLIITEWFVSVFIGVGLYAALVFLLF